MKPRKTKTAYRLTLALAALWLPLVAPAGNLDNAKAPSMGSGMPTLEAIHTQLATGTAASVAGSFQEPGAGPTAGTGKTLADILAILPALDNTNGALMADVLSTRTFWGLSNGQWGLHTGTMPLGGNVTGSNGTLSITVPAAYYGGSTTATASDSNLVSGNIKSGVSVFGVAGSLSGATGTATAADVLSGKTFSNGSATGISGTMPSGSNVTGSNGALSITVPAAYYSGSTTATASDANLLSGNIKSGVSVFGVAGSLSGATGTATASQVLSGATFSNGSNTGLTGSMANNGTLTVTPGTSNQNLSAGYYGSVTVSGDTDLVSGNIRSGVSVFGVAGSLSGATGTATASQVLSGATFSNGSNTGLTGSMANNGTPTVTPGTSNQSLSAGYYGGVTVSGDSDLVSGNIRSGVSVFGVSGAPNVVDTTEATAPASAADIASGKKAYVNGTLVNGTSTAATGHVAERICATGWGGVNCDVCAGQWSGASCNVCPTGWSGSNCDIIAKPFPTTVPTYASTPWKCVLDSATNLTWEVKTNGGGLHDWNNTYTWYDTSPDLNGGAVGNPTGGSCSGSGCDTEKYVVAVNKERLCGYNDWRMPSKDELLGLVTGSAPGPTIDAASFPNTKAWVFWSGSASLSDSTIAWDVHFNDGSTHSGVKTNNYYVRLVLSGQ